jgi:hypothetical protein
LARGTGSVTKAQQLLKLALDASTVSGKPLDTVATALSKAYNGNTTALTRMFPELKKSKDAIGDLNKEVEGAAVQQADPFMKFNNSMDILKEKLGNAILPMITDFVDQISKPGGLVDQVGKFLDDLSNPKTEAGATFKSIKDAIYQTIEGVKQFFALFGGGDAMKGFANAASTLIQMLPALIALKGILMLSKATGTLSRLAQAVGMISGGGALAGAEGVASVAVLSIADVAIAALAAGIAGATLTNAELGGTIKTLKSKGLNGPLVAAVATGSQFIPTTTPTKGNSLGLFDNPTPAPTVTINVHSADPKAVVDAVSTYVKTNGKVPAAWGTGKSGR